jgi:SAM-dependent methyltransferase
MSHIEQLLFVKLARDSFPEYFSDSRVLEVGSYDVNGSVRQFFSSPIEYTGIDLVSGPGVDIVVGGNEFRGPTSYYDVGVSCECFEHDPFWIETFANMIRMVRPLGMVLTTCASRGRLEHGTKRTNPDHSPGTQAVGYDYYHNITPRELLFWTNAHLHFEAFRTFYVSSHKDLFFIGFKRGNPIRPYDKLSLEAKLRIMAERISSIDAERWKEKSTISKLLIKTYELPMTAASYIFPDYVFQRLALKYFKMIARAKALVRRE